MKKSRLALVLFATFLIAGGITAVLYAIFFSPDIIGVREVYAEVSIGKSLGLNADNNGLMFGRLVELGSSKRIIKLTNNYGSEIKVSISANGNITPLLKFDDLVAIKPGEAKMVEFGAYAGNLTSGNYSGTVVMVMRK